MKLSQIIIAMVAAGCSAEQMGKVAAEFAAREEEAAEIRREKERNKKRKQRANNALKLVPVPGDTEGHPGTSGDNEPAYKDNRADITTPADAVIVSGKPNGFPESREAIASSLDFSNEKSYVSEPAVADGENVINELNFRRKRKTKEDQALLRAVGESWNELAGGLRLPAIQQLTPKRRAAVMARAKDLVEIYDFPTALEGFADLFGRIQASPFLRGEATNFRANLDFAITQSSFTKIMEGAYEVRPQKTKQFGR